MLSELVNVVFGTLTNHGHTAWLLSIEVIPLSFAIDGIMGVGFPRSALTVRTGEGRLWGGGRLEDRLYQTEQLLCTVGLLATMPSTTDSLSPTHVTTRLAVCIETSQQR